MFGWSSRSSLVVAAVVCAGLGAGSAWAVQASASGGTSPSPVSRSASPQPSLPKPQLPRGVPIPGATAKAVPAVVASNVGCGQTITASVTLNGDLDCGASGLGLTISGNNINLNLGGHTIFGAIISDGPGSMGVDIKGTTDTVQNGKITNFLYGVFVGGKTATILNVRANANDYGIADLGTGTKITTSSAIENQQNGIYSVAVGGTYSGDHELNNGGDGILLYSSANVLVTGNVADNNGSNGIWVISNATGNILTKNVADFNGLYGIKNPSGSFTPGAFDGGGNTAKGNNYAVTPVDPTQCFDIACS